MSTLLLWDIDGTLIRGKGAGKRAMNRAFLRLYGVEGAFDQIQMAGGLDWHFVGSTLERHGMGLERMAEFSTVYFDELRQEVTAGSQQLLPGVTEILQYAETDARLYNAVGTGNFEQGARIKLELFDLNRYFPVGGFCEAPVERYELLAAGVEKARQYYGVDFALEQVVVIGDTVKDIEAARKIGAQVIAVGTGGGTMEELEQARPDALFAQLPAPDAFTQLVLRLTGAEK